MICYSFNVGFNVAIQFYMKKEMILFFIWFFSGFSAIIQIHGQEQELKHCGGTLHTPSAPSSEFIMELLWTLKKSCQVVDDLNPLNRSHSFLAICDKACFTNCRFFGFED